MTHCIQNRITRRAVLGGAAALAAASLPAFGQGKVVWRRTSPRSCPSTRSSPPVT